MNQLTTLEKINLRKAKTLKILIDEIETLFDLNSGDVHIFNREIIILGLEKALQLTNAKRKNANR
jgi:hypothetical protein